MSTDDRFRRKLTAFLHDPIDKPLVLMRSGQRHEERADQLQEALGLYDLPDGGGAPDHVASAMERAFVPERGPSVTFLDEPEIRHSFSGKLHEEAVVLTDVNLDGATEDVEKALQVLAEQIDATDPRAAFFTLWRTLLPALREHTSDLLAPFWSVLPADTRIPDHGLFQHLTVTSAFSSLKQSDDGTLYTDATFLLVTIGPAQAFIREARKTQDLYWGSALLSRLAWAAMKPVVERFGPDAVVFPDLYGQPLVDQWLEECGIDLRGDSRSGDAALPTLPNRFLAVVETGDEETRRTLLNDIREMVYKRMDEIASKLYETDVIPADKREHVPREAVRTHLRDVLSVYGVALPFQPGDAPLAPEGMMDAARPYVDNRTLDAVQQLLAVANADHTQYEASPGHLYSLFHTLTEKMLAAQKNTRSFAQLSSNENGRSSGERGRKCSLCGERNVLFYRGDPAQIQYNGRAIDIGDAAGVDAAQMQDGEGLCGACFVKRFAGRALDGPERFPSTTKIALAPLRARHDTRFRQIESAFEEAIGDGGTFDDQLYFEENLRLGYLAKYVYPNLDEREDHDFLSRQAQRLQDLHAKHLQKGLAGQMGRYYGLLVLDGDHMGEWVSGKRAPRFENIYHSSVWEELPDALQRALMDLPAPEGEEWGRRPLTPALHAALSRALADYALEAVRPIVEKEHHGRLVYAGGDDVLAFVPLAEALDVALHLRAAFSGHRPFPGSGEEPTIDFTADVSGFRRRDGRVVTTLGPEASASAGLALAHYKTPLGEVLDAAYGMEQQAKDAGRDMLGMAVLKRSGERTEGLVPFTVDALDEKHGPVGLFQDLIDDLRDEERALSPTFIRTLRRELEPMLADDGTLGEAYTHSETKDLLRSEISRLLQRSLDGGDSSRTSRWIETMTDRLMSVWEVYHLEKRLRSVRSFLDVLDAVLFLYRETRDADVRDNYPA